MCGLWNSWGGWWWEDTVSKPLRSTHFLKIPLRDYQSCLFCHLLGQVRSRINRLRREQYLHSAIRHALLSMHYIWHSCHVSLRVVHNATPHATLCHGRWYLFTSNWYSEAWCIFPNKGSTFLVVTGRSAETRDIKAAIHVVYHSSPQCWYWNHLPWRGHFV